MTEVGPGPADLLVLAEQVARAAGEHALHGRPHRLRMATKSTPTDVVTQMDTETEQLVVEQLLAARPDDSVLGEEGSGIVGTSPVRWVVDPIDGTVNYLYELPCWAVSIAAELDGEVVAAAVFDPSHGELFSAVSGGGARLDGDPIAVSDCAELSQALIATGFGYAKERRASQAEVLRGVLPEVRDIRRFGAASLDLCALACGRVDGYYERGLNSWDHAAAGLVAREAGAIVGGLRGQGAGPDLVVAAGPGLFDQLRALLEPLGADRD
jgi:myo-inositol-1(or 4)-monophosphatase